MKTFIATTALLGLAFTAQALAAGPKQTLPDPKAAGKAPANTQPAAPETKPEPPSRGAEEQTANPFEQGTQKITLSDADRDSLLQYVNQSKAALEAALEDARGRSLGDTARIYSTVIRQIVIESYIGRQRTELLMRFILNQALELTYGVPNANGTGTAKAGVLTDAVNTDLITVILEDSIHFALLYVQSDYDAIRAQKTVDLPYVSMANARLQLAASWADSVLEDEQSAQLLTTILEHWLTTVAQTDQLHQAKLALEIRTIDSFLKEKAATIESSDQRLRDLRRKLNWLIERAKVYVDPGSSIATPGTAATKAVLPCGGMDLRSASENTVCYSSNGVQFRLVKRTPGTVYEVWQDLNTGIIWGDATLGSRYNWKEASRGCNLFDSLDSRGGMSDSLFTLPTKEDYQTFYNDGALEVIRPMPGQWNTYSWTNNLSDKAGPVYWEWNKGGTGIGDQTEGYRLSVRCITKGKKQ